MEKEEEDQTPPGGERLKRKGQKQDGNRGSAEDRSGDREKWRDSAKALCSTRPEEDRLGAGVRL